MFMRKRRRMGAMLYVCCTAVVLCLLWVAPGMLRARAGEEGVQALEQALRRAAVQCYALEGRYPASLDELLQKSGISPDEALYAVYYMPSGSNLMPDVAVLRR